MALYLLIVCKHVSEKFQTYRNNGVLVLDASHDLRLSLQRKSGINC